MPIAECTCCCCCKLCGWCVPKNLKIRLQNLTFPTCSDPHNGCGCDDTSWMNDMEGFVIAEAQESPSVQACRIWNPQVHTSPCGFGGASFDLSSLSAGRVYTTGCTTEFSYAWGGVCLVAQSEEEPIQVANTSVVLNLYCVMGGEPGGNIGPPQLLGAPNGLYFNLIFLGPGGLLGSNYCCWSGDIHGTIHQLSVFYTYFDSNEVISDPSGRNAVWDTDGPVCAEDGSGFVSQLWTFTTQSGISGEVLIYAY